MSAPNHRDLQPRARGSPARPLLVLGILILVLGAYRLTLIDTGHFYWGDERCYLQATDVVDALGRRDSGAAAVSLFDAGREPPPARPGFVLLSTLPVLAQRAVGALFGIDPQTLHYFDTASVFNVLVTLGISACMFGLGRAWTGNAWYGLLVAAVYSLLCNANVWIRHMVAYPLSMLCFLSALLLLSTKLSTADRGTGRVAAAGALSALGYACYPGHYAFVLINAAVAVARSKRRWAPVAGFGLASVAVLGVFEGLARFGGRSYLADLRSLSGPITMGDTREGYLFGWHYLRDAEGVVGVLLMGLFLGFSTLVLWRRRTRVPMVCRVAVAAAIAGYLFHATLGVVFARMVFYGRVLMVFLPFVVGGAVLALMHMRRPALRRVCVGGLSAASLVSFVTFARDYDRIVYPGEFLQETMTRRGRDITYPPNVLWGFVRGRLDETVEALDHQLVMVADPRPDGSDAFVLLADHEAARRARPRFIGVNFKYMWYVRQRYDRFVPPAGYTLVAEALHPEVFRAGWYEGRKPWERWRIAERQYTLRLYERQDPRPSSGLPASLTDRAADVDPAESPATHLPGRFFASIAATPPADK